MSGPVRLDRLLANLGYGSRRDIQALVSSGGVVLDGQTIRDHQARVDPTTDLPHRLSIRGRPVDPPFPLSIVMNKPTGLVCSHKEVGERIYDLLPSRWTLRTPKLSSVGRLDKETSGLLLLTDDGELLHRLISPRRHVLKYYVADLARPLRGDERALFASGQLLLEGDDRPLLPARLTVLPTGQAQLILSEGRYHQVRRMFAAVGNHVTALHRTRIGGLALPSDLAAGQFRRLSDEESRLLFAAPEETDAASPLP
jgi:16S rRNA pseudouridine516 synthase